jgi:hypothetical protein
MSLLNELRVDIGDDDNVVLSGVTIPAQPQQTIGPELGFLVRDLRVDTGDDETFDFASGIQVGALPSVDIVGPDILESLRDLRVDIGDDESLALPSGSGVGSLPNVTVVGPDIFHLLQDLRVDIGDDEGLNFPITSGIFPTQGPLCWNTTIVNTASYTPTINDVMIFVNPVAPFTTINLPAIGQLGCSYIIKDISGQAFSRNIIVNPGANTVDGFSSWLIAQNYQSITITWIGNGWGII